MKSRLEQLLTAAKEIRLSEKEKARTRDLLLRYMRMNPVREGNDIRHTIQRASLAGQRSPIAKISIIQFLYKPMVIPIIILVAIFAGGGVSLAANDALPGDVLYSVKTGVNENVRSVLAFSDEAKAEWKVEQVERRLQEAEKLASEGKLSENAGATLEAKFIEHTESMTSIASSLQATGKAEAAAEIYSSLEATLEAHAKILTASKSETGNEGAAQIIGIVEVQAQEAGVARVESETELKGQTDGVTKQAAEGKLKAAQNKIAEVRNFLAKAQIQPEGGAAPSAEVRLKAAENIVADGQTKFEAGAYGEAFVLFQAAIRVAQFAQMVAQAGLDLNIDLDDVNLAPPIPGGTGGGGTGGTGGVPDIDLDDVNLAPPILLEPCPPIPGGTGGTGGDARVPPDIDLDDVNLAPPMPTSPCPPSEPPGPGTETNTP